MSEYNVDPKRRHLKAGEPCEICKGPLQENHDNFECSGSCGFVSYSNHELPRTGVYVRAKYKERFSDYDIAELDSASLDLWVNERLSNDGKLRLIRILLGYV